MKMRMGLIKLLQTIVNLKRQTCDLLCDDHHGPGDRGEKGKCVCEILFAPEIECWIHMYVRASTSIKPSYWTFIIYTAVLTTSPHSFSRVEFTLV